MRNRKRKISDSVEKERKERIMRFIEENREKESRLSKKSQALKKDAGLASCLTLTPTMDQRLTGGMSGLRSFAPSC